MTATATKHLITITKAPTARGSFDGIVDANPPEGDKDGERIASFSNVPGAFPLLYQHSWSDPGAQIGTIEVHSKGDDRHLIVSGKLDLRLPMARAVHERMLLPSSDSMSLKELSVGFDVDRSKAWQDKERGVMVLEDVTLREVSVVYRGAQSTAIANVKDAQEKESTETRTLRSHLDSSHARGVRAFKPSRSELLTLHRLAHADLGPVSDRHLTTGVPDGGTVPVTSVMPTRTRAASKNAERRVQIMVAEARAAAKRDVLLAQANRNIESKLQADAQASMSFTEYQQAEAARDNWAAEKERLVMEQRDREREQEARDREAQVQAIEDFQEAQRRRDAEAVRDLLNQDGPTFQMGVDPATGQLRDPQ